MNKRIDFLVISFVVISSAIMALRFSWKPLIFSTYACLLPSLYLAVRIKKNWKKIFLAIFVFGGIFSFIFDFIETLAKAWYMKNLVFPWRIMGIVPIDDIIGFMFMTLFIVVFYEHFLDDEKNKRISKNLIWSLVPSVLAMLVIIVLYLKLGPTRFNMSYVYLEGGLVLIALSFIVSIWNPKLLNKLLKIGVVSFLFVFIREIVILKTGGWAFPGQYIGTVSLLGVIFPFKELFFWTMMYTTTVVAYYKLFVGDLR